MTKKKKKMSMFDFWITVIMLLILFITIYPLYFTVIASFSDPDALAAGKVILWPVGFTLESYQQVFAYKISGRDMPILFFIRYAVLCCR